MKTKIFLVTFMVILIAFTYTNVKAQYGETDKTETEKPAEKEKVDKYQLPPYSGPKARITVANFDVKAAKAAGQIGPGLREMLVTALIQSKRFAVLERQALQAIMQEQELAVSGAGDPQTGIKRGKIKIADVVVTAAVTEFEPEASGVKGGGGGLFGTVLGGIIGGVKKSHMALDIRIVDTSTSEIIAATSIKGDASSFDLGGGLGGWGGSFAAGGALSVYSNTPMEKAIRLCIFEAVKYLTENTPKEYFKY